MCLTKLIFNLVNLFLVKFPFDFKVSPKSPKHWRQNGTFHKQCGFFFIYLFLVSWILILDFTKYQQHVSSGTSVIDLCIPSPYNYWRFQRLLTWRFKIMGRLSNDVVCQFVVYTCMLQNFRETEKNEDGSIFIGTSRICIFKKWCYSSNF